MQGFARESLRKSFSVCEKRLVLCQIRTGRLPELCAGSCLETSSLRPALNCSVSRVGKKLWCSPRASKNGLGSDGGRAWCCRKRL